MGKMRSGGYKRWYIFRIGGKTPIGGPYTKLYKAQDDLTKLVRVSPNQYTIGYTIHDRGHLSKVYYGEGNDHL